MSRRRDISNHRASTENGRAISHYLPQADKASYLTADHSSQSSASPRGMAGQQRKTPAAILRVPVRPRHLAGAPVNDMCACVDDSPASAVLNTRGCMCALPVCTRDDDAVGAGEQSWRVGTSSILADTDGSSAGFGEGPKSRGVGTYLELGGSPSQLGSNPRNFARTLPTCVKKWIKSEQKSRF